MAGPCETGPCLPGADSGWFLLLLGAVWSVVLILGLLVLLVRRRERRPPRQTGRQAAPAAASAVTVAEIRARLARESAGCRRAPRVVLVVPRQVPPPRPRDTGPDTGPFDPLREDGDGDV